MLKIYNLPLKNIEQIPKANFDSVMNSLDIDRKGWGVEPSEKFIPGKLIPLLLCQARNTYMGECLVLDLIQEKGHTI